MKYKKRTRTMNILIVGASNTGKTSFIQTLAGAKIESEGEIAEHSLQLNSNSLRIYDLRGYGAKQNTPEIFSKIDSFVRDGYKSFLLEETKIERDPFFEDKRIHLMVLFGSMSNRGIKEYDITLLRMMNKKVNTLVIIPKCDYYTKEEIDTQKRKITDLLKYNNIDTFGVEENEEASIYALFSAEEKGQSNAPYKTRELPSGVVSLENENHSDYASFIRLLEGSYEGLLEITHTHFYEKYRTAMLNE